jgi:DNA processing protein
MSSAPTTSRFPDRGAGATPAPLRIERDTPRYPARLADLERPPAAIWVLGTEALAHARRTVAIVGTRQATPYGVRVTRMLAEAFVRAGVVVVSGMARGIDGAAHRAVLDAGGHTVAVLGTGADRPYPPSHVMLHQQIMSSGLVLSEQPPGARAHGGSFPIRNRLIAALADATIVVEAGLRSGADHTREYADAMGRPVGAVPGPIDVPQSQGTNRMIADGLQPITCAADALALLGLAVATPSAPSLDTEDQRLVWEQLGRGGATLDALCAATRLPAPLCLQAVTQLELRGLAECALTGEVRRR